MHLLVFVFLQWFQSLKRAVDQWEKLRITGAIAFSILLSKIFDNCIISNQYDSLFTNDLQFAYKSKTSTIHCVHSIFKTANHYVSSAGAAHVCMLDATKAFDRVNLLTLFRKLYNRYMCPLCLMNGYMKRNWQLAGLKLIQIFLSLCKKV